MLSLRRFLHTPRGLKQIPIPKKDQTLARILETVPEASEPVSTAPRPLPSKIKSLFPETIELSELTGTPTKLGSSNINVASSDPNWFAITNTKSGYAPIYARLRRHGAWQTEIRRIEGNASSLRSTLVEDLNIPVKSIRVSNTGNRLFIKGNLRKTLKEYFSQELGLASK